jgi:hypothetical protein
VNKGEGLYSHDNNRPIYVKFSSCYKYFSPIYFPTCKGDSIFQIHLHDEIVYQVRLMQYLGNWPMRKEIDGYPVLYNISLVSLVTINNSELIYTSHQKVNSVRKPAIHMHIL